MFFASSFPFFCSLLGDDTLHLARCMAVWKVFEGIGTFETWNTANLPDVHTRFRESVIRHPHCRLGHILQGRSNSARGLLGQSESGTVSA